MKISAHTIISDVAAGIAISFVTLSLSGAFGILSGRGVMAGMISAVVYQLITSCIGGTRLQCSGPTGPMTAVFVAMAASAAENSTTIPAENLSAWLNMTLFLSAVLLLIMGVFRLGRLVTLVPNVVISGFMNGIALIIWLSQAKKLLQIGSSFIGGDMLTNIIIAAATMLIGIGVTMLTSRSNGPILRLLSGTLVSLVLMTIVTYWLPLSFDTVVVDNSLRSLSAVQQTINENSPAVWPWTALGFSIFWAVQLAGVAYLDTLLTSLILDRRQHEHTKRNQELAAQGLATGLVALMGGIPGAQATERSVLLLKEGAQTRLAGISVAVASLLIIVLLQDVLAVIPKAVFAGLLLKIGYDVFDWQPLTMRMQGHRASVRTYHLAIITLTALLTVLTNVMIAVVICTIVFLVMKKKYLWSDLQLIKQTEGLSDEP